MHLGSVRVEHDHNIEQMLGVSDYARRCAESKTRAQERPSVLTPLSLRFSCIYCPLIQRQFVFGLYTAANSYFLQAPSERDMEQWMNSLSIRR